MIVYNILNSWVFGCCPSSSVLHTPENMMFWKQDPRTETDPVSEILCSLVSVQYWTMHKVQKPTNSDSVLCTKQAGLWVML
jgi:hypothetical protein